MFCSIFKARINCHSPPLQLVQVRETLSRVYLGGRRYCVEKQVVQSNDHPKDS